ncbi:MAG: hypothetical protein GY714_20735 [Desulfobacterales bacterium]|nr:hypothetical protein [Desulfobacterales bacterium]
MSKTIEEYIIKCPQCSHLNSTFSDVVHVCGNCKHIIDVVGLNKKLDQGLTK